MVVRAATWVRVGFAGPGAVIAALVTMAGMPLWLPAGAAGIDNYVLPIILLPIIWVVLVFHACLDSRLARVALVSLGLVAMHGAVIVHHNLSQWPVSAEHSR